LEELNTISISIIMRKALTNIGIITTITTILTSMTTKVKANTAMFIPMKK